MQGVAAKNDASYDLSRTRASVTGQTTIAASTATTSLPNGRIVTRGCPAPTQWRSVKSCPTSPSNPSAAVGTPSFWLPSRSRHCPPPRRSDRCGLSVSLSAHLPAGHQCADRAPRRFRMTVSQTEGWGGYDPKGLAWTRTVRLPLPVWDSLELALAAAHFWSDTVPEGPGGLDGSRWILEGIRTDRRVLVDHWSPQEVGPDAAFRRAGNYILDLAERA